ncbi:MAG TPA: translocation/assembly module TamB domain-containing protein, partial [Nitrospiria bacterium]|nr:translocation/assembly module TamB domain-containing protein [Nitrospiria bacterium]
HLVLKTLQDTLGPEIQVEAIKFDFIATTITLEKVLFPKKKQEDRSSLSILEAKLALSRWSLLTEVLVIKKITLKEPEIDIIRDRGGQVVWPALPLNSEGSQETAQKQKVLIRRIVLENGRVIYRDRQKDWHMDFSQLQASIRPDLKMKNFEVEFAAEQGEVIHQDLGGKNLKARGKLSVHPTRIDLASLELSMDDSTLTLHGDITDIHTPQPTVNLLADGTFSGLPLQRAGLIPSHLTGVARVHTELRGAYPGLRMKGNAFFQEINFKEVNVFAGKLDFYYSEGILTIDRLEGETLGGHLNGNLVLEVFPTPMNYQAEVRIKDLILEKIHPLVPKGLAPTGKRLSGEIKASGSGFSPERLQARGWLKAIRSSLDIIPTPPKPSGQPAEQPHFTLPLDEALKPFNQIDLEFETSQGAMLRVNASMGSDASSIRLNGTAGLGGGLDFDVNLITQDASEMTRFLGNRPQSPKPRFLDLAGPLQFSGSLKSTIHSPTLEGMLLAEQALLRGKPVGSLNADLVFAQKRLTFEKAILTKPPSRYEFAGQVDFTDAAAPEFNITAGVSEGSVGEVIDLFYKRLPLDALGKGTLTMKGIPTEFLVEANLDLHEVRVYDQHFEQGEVIMGITQSRISFSKVRLQKERTVVEGAGWLGFNKQFSARLTSDELHLEDLDSLKRLIPYLQADLSGEITGSGDFQAPEVHGRLKIKGLSVSDQNLGSGEIHMTLVARNLAFQVSVGQKQTQASGLLRLEKGLPIKANLSFIDFPLEPFLETFYPKPFENITLLTSGRMLISGKAMDPKGLHVEGNFTQLSANIAGYKITNQGEGILEFDDGHLQIKSFQLRGEGTSLSVSGDVHLKESLNLFVNGEADLDVFRLLTHEFSYGKGKAYLVLKITDQWDDPKIQGGLTVQEGVLRSETLRQTLTITSMGLFFNQRQVLLETLEGEASGGHFQATGKLELKNLLPDNFGLMVDLSDVRTALGEGSSVIYSGSFVFQGNPQSHQLRGEAQIRRATYTKRLDLKTWILELQKKQEQPFISSTPFLGATKLDIHLSGRDNIWVNNNLAKLPLEIDLFLKGTFDHPLLFGHVEARDGEVYFRGHEFKVQSGTLDFFDRDRIAPVVDLKAAATVRNYRVEMNLTGKLGKGFDPGLTSDPPLSETDILALLTVGKTAEELAELSGTQGKEEATAFTTSVLFEEFVEDRVKRLTGIDRFQVDPYSTSSKAAAGPRLTVQKRLLDEKLSVTYISAVDPAEEQVIKVEYQLGRDVSLIGERDEKGRAGGDIRFRLEFR